MRIRATLAAAAVLAYSDENQIEEKNNARVRNVALQQGRNENAIKILMGKREAQETLRPPAKAAPPPFQHPRVIHSTPKISREGPPPRACAPVKVITMSYLLEPLGQACVPKTSEASGAGSAASREPSEVTRTAKARRRTRRKGRFFVSSVDRGVRQLENISPAGLGCVAIASVGLVSTFIKKSVHFFHQGGKASRDFGLVTKPKRKNELEIPR